MNSEKTILPSLGNIEWKALKIETNKINHILPYIPTNNITELNELIYAGAKLVCENIGIPSKSKKKQQKPGWEIRLESQIKKTTKTSPNDEERSWNKRGGEKEKATWGKITVQLEEINQKILTKEGRLKRYQQNVKQYRQNRTFQNNEREFYQQYGGSDTKTYQEPDAKETERFWAKIWEPKKHNENAEWINNITRALDGLEQGPKIEIHVELLKTTQKRISNWKAQGHDGIHGFWFKKFTSIHDRLALEMNRCLQDAHVPEWMTKGKTTFIQKDPSKGTAPNNYRPITCLPMMWKILTAQIREKIYYSLTSRGLFPDKQKGCRKGSRGTAELLFIDQHILNVSKTRRKNLAMAWLDYKKAYDMLPQSWILHCLKMYKISHEVINFIEQTMKTRRVKLTAGGRGISETKIQRSIFLGDALSPLLFIIAMMPLKMHCRTQTKQIAREDQPPNVHGWHWIICKKWKRTGNPHTRS